MTVRWGIIGTGDIARQFAEDIALVDGAVLQAIGSRRAETAAKFGERHRIARRHDSYEALARDDEVDAVYVATPHPQHFSNGMKAIEHDKAVLCEKPLAMNTAQARALMDAAQKRGVFLMEGLWTLFFPAIRKACAWIADGAIGPVRLMRADFCFRIDYAPEHRLFNRDMGGGALLDVGIYPLLLAQAVFGAEPEHIHSAVNRSASGVDEQAAITLHYGDGAMAVLTCGSRVGMPQEALIAGTEGTIRIPERFSQPDRAVLERNGQAETCEYPRQGLGYHLEIAEASRCIASHQLQSAVASHDMSLALARTLDRIRESWGLTYPNESAAWPRENTSVRSNS